MTPADLFGTGRIILLCACIGVADWLSIRLSAKWEQDSSLEFSPSVMVRMENSYSITGMITQTRDTVRLKSGMIMFTTSA
jgi:hypothetical protein